MPDDKPELTAAELHFCHEYAAAPDNATRAYMRAFKHASYKSARTLAARLLAKVGIKREVKAAQRVHQRACKVDGTRTLLGLAAIAFADPIDIFDEDAEGLPMPKRLSQVPPYARKAVQSLKVKRRRLKSDKDATGWEVEEVEYKFADKMSAFDKLCRHLGITKDGAALQEFLSAIRDSGAGVAKTSAADDKKPPASDADDADPPLTVADVK